MKKTFVIQVEYPNCDFVSSEKIAEVLNEKMDSIGDYLDANIMDGVKDRLRIKVWHFSEMKRPMEE